VSVERPQVVERAFAGAYTRALLAQLRDLADPETVQEVLAAAGEARPMADLSKDSTWSSYWQLRALLQAAGRKLDQEQLFGAGQRILELDSFDANLTVQAGQSPNWVLERLDKAVTLNSSILRVRSSQVAEDEWLITQSFVGGLEMFREFCAISAGGHSLIPVIYGLPPADVIEEQCATEGAPECVFRFRWHPAEGTNQQIKLLQARVRGLENWLSEFEQTVRKVVSSQELSAVLETTFESACRAVHAPVCVLAMRHLPMPVGGQVFSVGVDQAEAGVIAARVLADDPFPATHLVAEVVSARRTYGRIAMVRASSEFHPEEMRRLQLYGRLIAAALDSEFSIAEAQRQEQGSRALLELALALDQITTVDEVPAKLIQAVPGVMNLDRVVVVMPAADRSNWTVRATIGYSPDVDLMLRGHVFEMPGTVLTGASLFTAGTPLPGLAELAGTDPVIVVPFVVNDEWAGSILAPVDPDRVAAGLGRQDEERLEGLAAQASTAISNAKLLTQVRHQALHDSLTGLPNRALILDRADQLLARSRDRNTVLAVLFIDLDGFKEVNDTFGHAAGDELLLILAGRLKAQLRAEDTVGRLGGDEFVVLLEDTTTTRPEQVAERILAAAREPFAISESGAGLLSVTASIGIATGQRTEAGQLLRDADVALYDAKAAGKNRFVVFREEMQVSVHRRVLLQMQVQEALRVGELSLLFRPCVELATGRVAGVEASARWSHPERGQLDPHEFAALLEDGGAVLDLGRWVLTEACAQLARWQRSGLDLFLGLPVSSHHLHDESFIPDLELALRSSGVQPQRLVVHIGEQVLRSERKATQVQLEALHALGVRIAVEGFGAGGFSVTSLRNLPIDVLKIDESFVRGLAEGGRAAALIHTLIQVAAALGLQTLADGVAHREDGERLIREGCEYGQGPFLAAPMTAEQIEVLLRPVTT
jgi:diguanylate cyclase (GGDEF)-like protein